MGAIELIFGILCIGYLIYYMLQSPYNYWKKLNIKGPKPHPLFGNLKDVMLVRKHITDVSKEIYDAYPNEKLIGIYTARTPILLIKDLDLIKDVLIKDFSSFMSRGRPVNEKMEPLSQHLFALESKRWRPLRIKLSPVFTSGKLKDMFYLIQECCDKLHVYLDSLVDRNEVVEVRELTAKFMTDVIGNCVFGLEMNALADEESEFRRMGRNMFKATWYQILRFRLRDTFPKIYQLLAFALQDRKNNNFFMNTIKQNMDYRDKKNIVRHDFVDILRELKSDPSKVVEGGIEMTDSLLASQAFVFFVAGFETSSTTISHMLYELAQHHDIQDKLRDEIMTELKKEKGILKYNSIKNMKFMHQVFQETLRKYSVTTNLVRESSEPYTFAGTKVTIPAEQKVWIPVSSIHLDPNIYPNPDVFDPQRFTEEAKKARHPMTYLPFGDGPRNCIGERFAVYQVKTGLSKIIENYQVDICGKTRIPYVRDPAARIPLLLGGIKLKFTKLNKPVI